MNKVVRIARIILIIYGSLFLALVIFLLILGASVWYDFFDVIGLELYKDQPIKEIYTADEKTFFVTEDNEVFVAGGPMSERSRKYANASSYRKNKWEIESPVKCFEGGVAAIYAKSAVVTNHAYLITTDGVLYELKDIKAEKIAESVKKALYSEGAVYILHPDLTLVKAYDNAKMTLMNGVVDFCVVGERVFVILESGDLCELLFTSDGEINVSSPLLSDAVSVQAAYSFSRYYNPEPDVYDAAILNALDKNGNLYAKGTYCRDCLSFGEDGTSHRIKDWTVIGTKVESYSVAGTGTVMLTTDSNASYYGYVHQMFIDIEQFGEASINVDNVKNVFAEDEYVIVADEERLYVWGTYCYNAFIFDPEPNIFVDEPEIFELK